MTHIEAFNNNQSTLSTRKFSMGVFDTHGDVKVIVNVEDVLSAYEQLLDEVSDASPHYNFLKNGLNFIKNDILGRGYDVYQLNAATASRLTEMFEFYELETPSWIPSTDRVEGKGTNHKYTYLFDWGTVSPSMIPTRLEGWFNLYINNELKPREQKNTLGSNLSQSTAKQFTNIKFPPFKGVETSSTNPEPEVTAIQVKRNEHTGQRWEVAKRCEHSLYVAQKYTSLHKSAAKRGLDFTLSLFDLDSLLRNATCHFTGEKLVHFQHNIDDVESGKITLPDNYLTIDRLDSDLGYIEGNVVLCGLATNKLKDRMSNEDFNKAMNVQKLVASMGLNKEQIALLSATI
ncbi:conserved hypothetical protein [Vibrio chagasii]|nr:conserved hypothetical protein [Vibrio chagasii]